MPIWLIILLGLLGVTSVVLLVLKVVRYYSNFNRSINMVFLDVRVPKKESKEDREIEGEKYSSTKDFKEVVGVMTHFYEALHSLYTERWYRFFKKNF